MKLGFSIEHPERLAAIDAVAWDAVEFRGSNESEKFQQGRMVSPSFFQHSFRRQGVTMTDWSTRRHPTELLR